jgi:hypothetical protein
MRVTVMLELEMELIKEKLEEIVVDIALSTDSPFDFIDLMAEKNDISVKYCKDMVVKSMACHSCGDVVVTNQWGICDDCISHSHRVA